MKLKQLFCKHIWKPTKTEPAGVIRKFSNCGGCIDIDHFRKTIVWYGCVKCGRVKVEKHSTLVHGYINGGIFYET